MQDAMLARKLLRGDWRGPNPIVGVESLSGGVPRIVFLSSKTKPSENEARRALCRILRDYEHEVDAMLRAALAEVFDPDPPTRAPQWPRLKAVLKKRSRGHSNPYGDAAISSAVFQLRAEGKHYDDAADEVAALVGKSTEHVKRIYAKSLDAKVKFPRRQRRKR
jgi:hypothetical protein